MTRTRTTLALACAAAMLPALAAAQPAAKQLTQDDYIAIQQLNNRYIYAVDTCTNSGNDYADLYTADGTFGVSEQWGADGKIWAQGREALAKAGGGGPDGCREKKPGSPGYGMHHLAVSLVVTPSAEGATGKSTLLTIGVGGKPTNIEWQGGYADVYVKTPQGWRIKSRWHVWPEMRSSIQFNTSPPPALLGPQTPAASVNK